MLKQGRTNWWTLGAMVFKRYTPFFLRERRFWMYALLPLSGTVGVILAYIFCERPAGATAIYDLLSGIFHVLPAAFLVRRLDHLPPGPLQLRISWRSVRRSSAWFMLAIIFGVWRRWWHFMVVALLMAVVAGFLATVPVAEFSRRCRRCPGSVALALLGVASYFTGDLTWALWDVGSHYYVGSVPYLIGLCDIETVARPIEDAKYGTMILLHSDRWDLLIGQQCSCFMFVFLFVSLFSTLALQGPNTRYELAILARRIAAIVCLVLTANLVRLADLFCFSYSIVRQMGKTSQAEALIDAHHQAAAWFIAYGSLAVFSLTAFLLFRRED